MDVRQLAFLARQPSAALTDRQRFWGMPKRGIALILANAMFWQPLLVQAEGIALSGGTNTSLGQAGNGVPIVNIAAPSASGLSHNQFQQYNVDAQGVILNNIAAQTGATQLGGIIVGNPNMNNGVAARTILNEVVGANATQLKGYTEVAGQAARVIVANSHGISCNGCGFINTPQVTLTTGKPVLDGSGGLVRFNVQGGVISFDGAGLNADNVDQFDIITRSAKINAELHAKRLNIVAGRNDVDANTLNATPLADDGSAKPELAIDSSALGGMYAGAIKLVGTEAGVGVRLVNDLVASGGDIQIDANGHLSMAQVAANGAVNVKANSIDANGPMYAGSSLTVNTPGSLTTNQNVAARDLINLSSGGQLTNNAIIESGVNADNSRNASGDVVLAANNLKNTGSIVASRSLQAKVTQTLNNQGATLSGQSSTRIEATIVDNRQSGRVLSQSGSVNITANQLLNAQSGLIASGSSLTITAGTLDNSQQGKLSSTGVLSAQIAGQLLNQLGLIGSNADLLISASLLDNRNGEISSLANLTANGGQADNSGKGRMLASADMALTFEGLNNQNQGTISGQRDVQLNLGQLTNSSSGSVYAKRNLALVGTGQLNNNQGVLRSDGTLALRASSLGNTGGSITSGAGSTLSVTDAIVNQGGELLSDAQLTLSSASLDNSQVGRIAGTGVVITTGAFNNQQNGRLTSTDALRLSAGQVNNSAGGRIASAMALTAVVTGLDQTGDGRLYSNSDVSLDMSNGTLNNRGGLISSPGQLLLRNLNAVGNQQGEISSANGFTLAARSVDNTAGTLLSNKALIVRVDELLTNIRGSITATGIDLQATELNNASGSVSSDADLDLRVTGRILNQSGELSSAGNNSLSATSLDNSNGQIMADKRLSVRVDNAIGNQAGTLGAGQAADIRAASLDNRQSGAVVTDGQLDLTLSGLLDNRVGNLQAKGLINLQSQTLDNRGGSLTTQDLLTVRSSKLDNRGGSIRADKNLKLVIDALDNSQIGLSAALKGLITTKAGLEFTGTSLNNQSGLINAAGLMQLQADEVLNNSGRIASQSDMTATVGSLIQQGGELVAQGNLTLVGNVLDNRAGGLVGTTKALTLDVDTVDNRGGEISSQVDVRLAGQSLDNSDGGKVLAGTALELVVAQVINRNKGLLFGNSVNLAGAGLDNTGGSLASNQSLSIDLSAALDNTRGLISSEAGLTVNAASLQNTLGSLSSAQALNVTTLGALGNQGGSITTDTKLTLISASLDNSQSGTLSGKGATRVETGTFDNSHSGRLTSSDTLSLIAGKVINQSAGRIASALALTASVTSLDQQAGEMFSNTSLTLDMNKGQLNNQGGLINAPGALLLKNLADVANQNGEISSAQAFTLNASNLDNSGGKLLSSQALTLVLDKSLQNIKGTIAAAALNIQSANLDNTEGLISSRDTLEVTVDTTLTNTQGTLIADADLTLSASVTDSAQGLISSKQNLVIQVDNLQQAGGRMVAQKRLTFSGTSLDNTGGTLMGLQGVDIDLSGLLNNSKGLISSEETLTLKVGSLTNTLGSVSSAQTLTVHSVGAISNQGGELVTDGALDVRSLSLDNRQQGNISSKGLLTINTGDFDNSQKGRVSSGEQLDLTATQLTNRDGGSIGSSKALTASVTGLDQQNGSLFSNTALTLDMNNGQLNNQGGLINAPGALLLNNLNNVLNQGGEISSAEAFTLDAQTLDNSGGKLLSNQQLTVRVARALSNVKGMIAAAGVDVRAATLDNIGGTLTSRSNLDLNLSGLLINRDSGLINAAQALVIGSAHLDNKGGQLQGGTALTLNSGTVSNTFNGLINSRGTLNLTADILYGDSAGEVSATGDMTLTANEITMDAGRLIGDAAVTLDLQGGDLDSRNGLITARGPLNLNRLRDLNNRGGEISSDQSYALNARNVDNSGGKLISSNLLAVNTATLINQNGLISGWQGLDVSGNSLDNRNNGTLSSRNGNLKVDLNGALLNGASGALVSQGALRVEAASLDNQGGILSSGAEQNLTVTGLLNNSQNGLIDSGAGLVINAATLNNSSGSLTAQQTFNFAGQELNNSAGNLSSKGAMTLDVLGALTNTNGKLASGGALLLQRSAQINNQGGQLISQSLMTLNTAGNLDNRTRGTVASNDRLVVNASGAVLNSADGLIYSQNADLSVQAARLDNATGTLQGQGAVTVNVAGDIDNQTGRITAQGGALGITAASLDNRGGLLSSMQGAFTANVSGVLSNGYALNSTTRGGVIQAQRLNLTAWGGFDNYGGRISAANGDALITTANFDNRNGGLYAKGLVRVTGANFDNSGDNDDQIAGNQVDLNLSGELNNRLGIIESDSTLNITAASLDNQTGQIRALGAGGTSQFRIGTTFDNRNGSLEVASNDLIFNTGSFLNAGGTVLHAGTGNFDIATPNLINAGGSVITRGGLTLTADNWTNSSVIQAGRLTVNVGTFNQTASGQLLASNSFVGTGGNWTNDGLIASDGSLQLNLNGAYAGPGRVSSIGSLSLSAASLSLSESGQIASGGTANISASGPINNYGRMTSNDDLLINTASLSNYGTVGSAQNLTVNTSQLLNQKGLIFSGANMQLRNNTLKNNYGDIYSLGDLTISRNAAGERADVIENISGSLESAADMRLLATSISNRREMLTFTEQRVNAYIAHSCSHCSDEWNVWYYVNEVYERTVDKDSPSAFLTSGGNLDITGSNFLNQYSSVSAAKNINITVDTFKNEGVNLETITYSSNYKNPPNKEPGSIYLGLIAPGGAVNEFNKYSAQYVPLYRRADGGYFYQQVSGFNTELNPDYDPSKSLPVPEAVTKYGVFSATQTASTGKSINAIIQSGGNTTITASTSLNNSVQKVNAPIVTSDSKVDATGTKRATTPFIVHLNSQLPPDLAQQQVNPLTLPGFSLPTGQNGLFRLSAQASSNTTATQVVGAPVNWTMASASISQAQREQAVPDLGSVGSIDQIANSTRQLAQTSRQNAGISANASTFDASAPAGSSSGGLLLTGHSADSTSMTSGGIVTGVQRANQPGMLQVGQSTASVPTAAASQNVTRVQGVPSSAARPSSQKYLIETNPVLTDLKQFMSSDYLLSALGYDPEVSAKRLGDGLYEQRLVQQAVTARTGQAFMAGQTSNEDQFRYLMNNAIASKDQLNLSLGVSLSSQQVAALTHDIVWLEEHEVNGEKVLVPVLYLAQANNRLGPTGALIAGNDVSLIAGQNLDNVGTLLATNNLSAAAGNNLTNAGLIEAGSRLDLLAGNDLVNKAGGIIAGRDVSLTALNGDVLNERAVTTYQDSSGESNWRKDFVDNAARIEAANDLSLSAGRDINNVGSVLQSGRDMDLQAGRDVNIVSAEVTNSLYQDARHNSSDITQLGSSVSAGRDLSVQAGRDLNAVASDIDAKRDIAMAATENLTISSAADEEHSLSKSKKVTRQQDHVSQVMSDIQAGGNVALQAGQNLAVISSRITAGQEAYLVAGDTLAILAAQDSDYSLYDMKKKGSWGKKKTQRDEVTDIKNIGSEITTGGDLILASGGDQHYQVAKLNSGNDLLINSGGAITFEGVKDLHDESHIKSNNDAFWTSSKGKGNTDETLRQTQMAAAGNITIKAVEGLKIDIREVNQQSVSQTIDAMVQADPQLAWLKEAEKRGDVDWRQVKEIHESFKYSTSGLGPASQLIIAIMLSMVMGPMMATWSTMAQAGTIAVATKATVSTIDNRGNLGAVIKDVTSKDSLKGYAVAVATAGVAGSLGYSPNSVGFNAEGIKTVAMKVAADAAIKTAVYGGSFQDNLASSLAGTTASIGGAYGAGKIGGLELPEGSLEKIALHSALGGLLAVAMGGDFRTGAIAGGANEALVGLLGSTLLPENLKPGTPEYLRAQANLVALSKIVGVLGAAATNGDVNIAAEVAGNATQYNYLNHTENNERFEAAQACANGSKEACVRRDELTRLDEERDKALWTACNGAALSSACSEKRMEARTARIDLLKHKNTPEARDQLRLAFSDPELFNYTLLGELRSTQKLDNAVVEQIATSISKSLLSFGADMTPVIGDVKAFSEAEDNWDYLFASVGILPGLGDFLAKGLLKAKALLKEGKAQEASDLLESLARYDTGAKETGAGKAPYSSTASPDAEAGMPYTHPVKEAGPKGEVSGLLPKPGTTSIPASGVGAGAAFKVDSKQLGKKLGKHVEDFGGNAASPADRKMVLDKIHDVGSNPEKVIPGTFAGQGANGARGDVFFRVKGNDVVVTKPDGTFVTILKDGVTQNPSVQSALKGGVR